MKILGIDYGRSKIGVAVGDTETGLVEPLTTIKNYKFSLRPQSEASQILNFKSILNEQMIQKIVMGMPGGKMDQEIKSFGDELQKQSGLKVEFFDETLTTQDAQRILLAGGGRRKSRKEKEDAVAAAIMLEYFMKEGQANV